MKKTLFLLTIVMSNFICAKEAQPEQKLLSVQDLSEHGQKWANQMVQKLNIEELQLLANYLYFNFLTARYDQLIRVNFIHCQNHLNAMQFMLNARENEAQKNGNLLTQQIAFLQEEAIPLRAYANACAQACFEHIEDSPYPALKNAISKFQQYSLGAINQFIQKDWSKGITKLLSMCSDSMKKEGEKLLTYQNDLQSKISLEMGDDAQMYGDNFREAIHTAELTHASYLNLIASTLNVKSMHNDILNINAILYTIFYNHLLNALKSVKKINSCSIMFDENGLIEEEDQDEFLQLLNEKFAVSKKHLKSAKE